MGSHRRATRPTKSPTYIKHTLPSDKAGMRAAKREWLALLQREAETRKGGRPKGSGKRNEEIDE